jgi:putative inorganic carbon (hco3(-)) transporter
LNAGLNKRSAWFEKSGLALIVLLIAFVNLDLALQNNTVSIYLVATVVLIAFIVLILKYTENVLYLLVFTIPLSISFQVGESNNLNGPSELICVLFCVYLFFKQAGGFSFSKEILRHPLTLLLLADLLWLLVTAVTSQMPAVSLKRWVIRLVYLSVYYLLFAQYFKSNSRTMAKMFVFYCLGLVVPIIYYLVQHAQIQFAIQGSTKFSQPFYNDHTVYGAALVYFLPYLFYYTFTFIKNYSFRLFYILLISLFVVAVFFSYSRAAWLSLFCALAVYLIFKWKIQTRTIVVFSIVGAIFLLFMSGSIYESLSRSRGQSHGKDVEQHFKSVTNISTDASNIERINRWKCAWRMFLDKPFLGFGPGTYQFYYGQFQVNSDVNFNSTFSGDKGHAHSEYLNTLSETGIFGLLIFLVTIIVTCRTAASILRNTSDRKAWRLTMVIFMGLITFYVHSFFNGFIESDKMAMPVFASMAALVVMHIQTKEKGNVSPLNLTA